MKLVIYRNPHSHRRNKNLIASMQGTAVARDAETSREFRVGDYIHDKTVDNLMAQYADVELSVNFDA